MAPTICTKEILLPPSLSFPQLLQIIQTNHIQLPGCQLEFDPSRKIIRVFGKLESVNYMKEMLKSIFTKEERRQLMRKKENLFVFMVDCSDLEMIPVRMNLKIMPQQTICFQLNPKKESDTSVLIPVKNQLRPLLKTFLMLSHFQTSTIEPVLHFQIGKQIFTAKQWQKLALKQFTSLQQQKDYRTTFYTNLSKPFEFHYDTASPMINFDSCKLECFDHAEQCFYELNFSRSDNELFTIESIVKKYQKQDTLTLISQHANQQDIIFRFNSRASRTTEDVVHESHAIWKFAQCIHIQKSGEMPTMKILPSRNEHLNKRFEVCTWQYIQSKVSHYIVNSYKLEVTEEQVYEEGSKEDFYYQQSGVFPELSNHVDIEHLLAAVESIYDSITKQ